MLKIPLKLRKGDQAAILSPSGGLPEIFPAVFDQGLARLREVFDLIPVEFPTTRVLNSSLESRAKDVHEALQNPDIKAIICSIGGDDQIKLLKHLDPEIIKNNPKIFMGYSDATNLCQYLTQVGSFVTYYGPAVMCQFGISGQMDEYTIKYLQKALFETGEMEILPSPEYSETFLNWRNTQDLAQIRPMLKAPPWIWHNFSSPEIKGELWGGCLESLDFQLRANRFLPPESYFDHKILYLETSEECPDSNYVYRVLIGLGERGLLARFQAILVGRARSLQSFEDEINLQKIDKYQTEQRVAIIKATAEYCPQTPILFNLDFGHTDPICVFPNGGNCRINVQNKRLFVEY